MLGRLTTIFLAIFMFLSNCNVYAENTDDTDTNESYCISNGILVNAGNNTGYTETNKIKENDCHYGWNIGRFYVSNYTRMTTVKDDIPVFLKNVDDKVKLSFTLDQDINKLNNSDKLRICNDKKGYDEYFKTKKTNFKKGVLIVKYTNYKNEDNVTTYTNYLEANTKKDANTQIELCEEGDYEVALDYKVEEKRIDVLGKSLFPKYSSYRIFFKFSVRNSNCMVYPFDIKTKDELTNSSVTENGFYLDFAKSRYLEINVKKTVLNSDGNALIEDTRFNKAAKDGNEYTDEGIYTFTVKNIYTNTQEEKTIYVGNNNILKAHVKTNLSIQKINDLIDSGATIDEQGNIQSSGLEDSDASVSISNNEGNEQKSLGNSNKITIDEKSLLIYATISLVFIILIFIILVQHRNNKKLKSQRNNKK